MPVARSEPDLGVIVLPAGISPVMGEIGTGKLVAFGVFCFVVGVGLGALGAALDVAWWLVSLAIFAALLLFAWYLRKRESGRWSYEVRRYAAEHQGRRIELLFDERLTVINRLTLLVDGQEVDRETIFFGTKELTGAPDGSPPVTVAVGSGWVGTCTGAVLRGPGDGEQPMSDVTGSRTAAGSSLPA